MITTTAKATAITPRTAPTITTVPPLLGAGVPPTVGSSSLVEGFGFCVVVGSCMVVGISVVVDSFVVVGIVGSCVVVDSCVVVSS